MKREQKIITMGIGAIALLGVILGCYVHFGMIGPGLPPSINGWYFPQPEGNYDNGTRLFTNAGAEQYGMIRSISTTCPELFPVLSDDCIYAQFERFLDNGSRRTGPQYIVISWYFNNSGTFSDAERDLYAFLKRSGTVSDISLDLNPEFQRLLKNTTDQKHYSFTSVPVSQFTGNSTSGYFIEYHRPLIRDRQDYIIMYYGVLNDSDIRVHEAFLRTLLVQGGFPPDQESISRLQDRAD